LDRRCDLEPSSRVTAAACSWLFLLHCISTNPDHPCPFGLLAAQHQCDAMGMPAVFPK